ncbi:AAA family ATPase [Gilliamella apicola]|uniref:AAA family ATPase n=3 Tax=Gilliamella apicola TaxID=1196095 RepID=UPI00080EB319|nr:AAA family ATPase [Gilliamella apicola]OCG11857.1 hypothetical protein A9G14_07165 [Gilliamella apicola]
MYLESLKIINYRRFGEKDNIVYFVNPKKISHSREKNSTKQSLISPSTTLIIGKNNAGKTTITNALIFITDKQKKWPKSSDFNVYYLKNLIKTYKIAYENKEKSDVIQLPKLEFIVKVNYSAEDLTTNISGISINSNDSSEESIEKKVTYEPKEAVSFNEGIKAIFEETEKSDGDASSKDHLLLEKLCDLLDNCEYKITYINVKDGNESNPLHDLISIKTISANRHLNENVLSKVFQRIVSSQFEDINSEDLFKDDIETINKTITDKVQTKNESVSRILKKIEQNNHVDMKLKGNVSKKTILKSFIKYNFKEGDDFIPEDQFGLGYVNLLNIIGEIIYYIDTYEENCHQSRINLLIIEEPEIFMHPQMQEFFISRIDNAIHEALEVAKLSSKSKNSLHCQIILTTHSSHIVNSKVQSCKSFNNINYLTIKDKYTVAIPLDDNNILEENSKTETEKKKKKKKKKKKNDLLFLIKHIKYKVSELFFSDAVIFVEGVTEEALLPYYLEQNNILNNYHISIFKIDGSHSKVYLPLIERLNIPCLIITDLDIERYSCEKKERHKKRKKTDPKCPICKNARNYKKRYADITSLENRKTTNQSLKYFATYTGNVTENNIICLDKYYQKNYLNVVYQKDLIEGKFATSLEEAIILTNHNNDLLHKVILEVKQGIYNQITNNRKNKEKLKDNSFYLQRSLGKDSGKSKFASQLLYELIASDETEKPELPNYIKDGFKWLEDILTK